ncbi:MAG: hypothetical protein WCC60_13590 [Ilumatobacteraceae bacterium]
MKGRVTTVLSLAGVLFAGSAAALVNTSVLQGSGTAAGFGDEITVAMDVPAGPPTTVTGAGNIAPGVTQPALPPAASQAMYQIGDAGLVTLDTSGGVLAVVAAAPNAGWTVLSAQSIDAYNIEVQLQSGSSVVAFRANLLFGVVGTSVTATPLNADGSEVAPATTVGGAPPPVSSAATAPSGTAAPASAAPPISVANTSGTVTGTAAPATPTTQHHDDSDHDSDDHGGSDDHDHEDD